MPQAPVLFMLNTILILHESEQQSWSLMEELVEECKGGQGGQGEQGEQGEQGGQGEHCQESVL